MTDPDVVRAMLLLKEADVFLLMGSAMGVGFVGVRLLRRLNATALDGKAVSWSATAPSRSHVLGSVLFGLGWSLACTCPGPAAALLGQGRLAALWVVGGLVGGVALRGWVAEPKARATTQQIAAPAAGL